MLGGAKVLRTKSRRRNVTQIYQVGEEGKEKKDHLGTAR